MKESKKYTIELTENQVRVIQNALEEYFRLRMGQDFDFSMDMAMLNTDLSPENQNHDKLFDDYIKRRDHLRQLMRAYFGIAFEPNGYLEAKTDDMLIAECIWDAIRCVRGLSRFEQPLHTGSEPVPKIKVSEGRKL